MKLTQMKEKKLKQKQQELLQEIIYEIEKYDDEFYYKKEWKTKGYTCYGYRPRTIQMKDGVLQFKRRYYRKRVNGGGFFPADIEFDIESYARIGMGVKQLIYDWYNDMRIVKMASLIGISRQTVYNTLQKLGKKDIMYTVEPNEQIDCVFIQADEAHLAMQRQMKNNEEARMIMVYHGREKECKGRYKLIGKKYFLFTSQSDFATRWEDVYDYIDKKYPNCKRYYLGADGGKWITKGKEVFPRANYIYDRFHFVQSLTRIFGGGYEGRQKMFEAYNHVKNGEIKAFRILTKNWMKEVKENHFGKVENRQKEIYKINKNMEAIKNNWKIVEYHGTSAEGHVSHYLASHLSSRPKAFSISRLPYYLKIMEYKLNGIDFEQYYKSARRSFITKFKIAENEDTYIDTSYYSNVPALYSSNTNLKRALKSIIG